MRRRVLQRRYGHGLGYDPTWGPFPSVRHEGTLGDAGVVYEFNVKLRSRVPTSASWETMMEEAERALEDFADQLREKNKWIGNVYFTGRSGGWLAVEDREGRMTRAKLDAIAKKVGAGLKSFKKYLAEEYPEGS